MSTEMYNVAMMAMYTATTMMMGIVIMVVA